MATVTPTPTVTPPPAKMRVDAGRTFLPLCDCRMGWRGIPTGSDVTAWLQAVAHEKREHPGQQQAAKALAAARRRARDK